MVKTKFKQTEIGLVPEDWGVVCIGDVLQIRHGKSQKNVLNRNGAYPIYGTGGIMGYATEYLYNKPSVLIGRKGTIDKPRYLDKPFWTVDTLFYSEVTDNQSAKFLYYCFTQINWYNFNEASGVPSLNASTIENIQISLPPLPEQIRIAQALSDTDAWIESLEKLINKKRLIKRGATQELLTPKEDWKEVMLGEVANIVGGATPNTQNPHFWNGYIEWFTPTEIGYSKYLKSSLRKLTEVGLASCSAHILPVGSILLTTRAGIGDLGILTKPAATNQGFQSLIPLDTINGEFLYYLTSTLKNSLLQNASGSTFLEISPSKVKSIQIHIPCFIEQTRIATILSDMDLEIETLEKKLHKAKQLKQGMMQELLTGRIRLVKFVEVEKIRSTPAKGHNDQFNDAVLIATMASVFGSDNFPLTRFKYTKVSYLLKRYKEEQDAGYLKHAAGPYKPKTRYGGAEKIALQKKYIDVVATNYKGKEYEGFVASENVDEAIKYFDDWYGADALKWIEQYKFEKNDNLELWATVDMAVEDLKQKNEPVTVEAIKQILKDNKEWKDKLKRSTFSDINIQKAVIKLETLFT